MSADSRCMRCGGVWPCEYHCPREFYDAYAERRRADRVLIRKVARWAALECMGKDVRTHPGDGCFDAFCDRAVEKFRP